MTASGAPDESRAPAVRRFARQVVESADLGAKLAAPDPALFDDTRDDLASLRLAAPGRPDDLRIVAGRHARTPPVSAYADVKQRVRILHALANHELQAVELFAWALLAFPGSEPEFRRGLLGTLADEQRHFRLYESRIEALGSRFGAHPVSGQLWRHCARAATPLDFVCAMGLTLENANIDFAAEHADAARRCGDEETARALERVREDEVRHVAFAVEWLGRWKGPRSAWETFEERLAPPLSPARARGGAFDAASRRRAGFDEDFIARLAATPPVRPGGAPR